MNGWIEKTLGNEYDKYFRFFEKKVGEATHYGRIPREGYESMCRDHSPLSVLKKKYSLA